MQQLTTEEAIALHDSGKWKEWTPHQLASFQMVQDKLCVPFGEFHKAMEIALGRPVWTHEFGLNKAGLMEELAGRAGAPTMDEIIALIPAEKLLIVSA